MAIILASQSPRRRELMTKAGFLFTVKTSDVEEVSDATLSPTELCEKNALLKAKSVASNFADDVVIGADTLVFIDNQALGKPKDLDEAKQMLSQLSGRTHVVCTGVALCFQGKEKVFSVRTLVTFKTLSDSLIQSYMDLVPVLDKAGSYAYQDHGEMIIEKTEGDTDNVIGLPIKELSYQLSLIFPDSFV